MGEIKVDTNQLRDCADRLQETASAIEKAIGHIDAVVSRIDPGAYEGQLASRVASIASEGQSAGGRLRSQSENLRNELLLRADGFEQANLAGTSAQLRTSLQLQSVKASASELGFFFELRRLGMDFANATWNLAGFTGGAAVGPYAALIAPAAGAIVWNGRTYLLAWASRELNPQFAATFLAKGMGYVDNAQKLVKAGILVSAKTGPRYAEELRILGSNRLLKLGDLNPAVRSISASKMAESILSGENAVSGKSVFLVGLNLVAKGYGNWNRGPEYASSAVAVEAFKQALSIEAFEAGFAIGFGCGLVTGPGAIAAGIAVGLAASFAVDYAFEAPLSEVLPRVGWVAGASTLPIPFAGAKLGESVGREVADRTTEQVAVWATGAAPAQISLEDTLTTAIPVTVEAVLSQGATPPPSWRPEE